MARLSDVYGGSFIRATSDGLMDIEGVGNELESCVLTIKGKLKTHTFDDEKQQRVCQFRETKQELGLNKTNWQSIADLTGEADDDNWDGHQIELFVIPEPKSQTKHAIRIRKPRKAGRQQAAPKPAADDGYPPWDASPLGPVYAAKIKARFEELNTSEADFKTWCAVKYPEKYEHIRNAATTAEWGRGIIAAMQEYAEGVKSGKIKPGEAVADGTTQAVGDDIPF